MKIHFFLRSNKQNAKGEMPVCCLLSINGKQKYFSIGYNSTLKDWNDKKSIPKKTHQNFALIQKSISELVNRFELLKNNFELQNTFIELDEFKKMLLNEIDHLQVNTVSGLLQKYLQIKITDYENGFVTKGTIINIKGFVNTFLEFLVYDKKEKLDILALKRNDFESLKTYFFQVKKIKTSTAKNLFSFFVGFLDWCVDNEFTQKNVFHRLSIKANIHQKKEKVYLSVLELQKVKDSLFFKKLALTKDLFLISCYSGLAFCDLMLLDKSKVKEIDKELCLVLHRKKTNSACFVPIKKDLKCLLEKYDYQICNFRQTYTIYANNLRKILLACGIDKQGTHIGRKTFINLMINVYGVPAESVALMVGHKDIKMTFEHYANIEHNKILNDTKNLE